MTRKVLCLMGIVLLFTGFGPACKDKTPGTAVEEMEIIETGTVPARDVPARGVQGSATLSELQKQYAQERRATVARLKADSDKEWKELDRNLRRTTNDLMKEYLAQNPQVEQPLSEADRAAFRRFIRGLPESNPKKRAYKSARTDLTAYVEWRSPELKAISNRMKALKEQKKKNKT